MGFWRWKYINQINPIHTYAIKGIYNVTLTVSNNITGCTHEFIKPIKLTIPEASFDYLLIQIMVMKIQ